MPFFSSLSIQLCFISYLILPCKDNTFFLIMQKLKSSACKSQNFIVSLHPNIFRGAFTG